MTGLAPVAAGLISLGLLVLAIGLWGLHADVSWIAQPFYVWAWWGAILVLDGFTAARRGSSLLTTRRRHVPSILLWSTTFWFSFELLNLRFQNWYYVGVFDVSSLVEAALSLAFVLACFSTVFMGLFEAHDAVTATGLLRGWKGEPGKLPPWASYAVQGVGAAMAGLAIVFPVYLAPLIWGSLTFLIDPWNYRHGARSLLRDIENRDYGIVARFLAAGLVCGVLWESFNFFAPQKWIYTVRGLEGFKLFEMPLLGFLGFPALALDAVAAYSFISYWLLGNETWENPADPSHRPAPRPPATTRLRVSLLPAHVAFWIGVLALVNVVNVGSVELELEDLPGLSARELDVLRRDGIRRPRQLLRAVEDAPRRERLRADLGASEEELRRLVDAADLFAFKGIGARHGALLRHAGVSRVEELATREPETLHAELARIAGRLRWRAPRLDMVRVWVFAARSRGIVLRVDSD